MLTNDDKKRLAEIEKGCKRAPGFAPEPVIWLCIKLRESQAALERATASVYICAKCSDHHDEESVCGVCHETALQIIREKGKDLVGTISRIIADYEVNGSMLEGLTIDRIKAVLSAIEGEQK